MSVIYLLMFASLVVAAGFLGAFYWAVKNGQYDDAHTPAMRILLEDSASLEPSAQKEVD